MKFVARSVSFLAAVALLAAGCASAPTPAPENNGLGNQLRGPVVWADPVALAPDRERACARTKTRLVPVDHYGVAADDAGMLPDDFEGIRGAAKALDVAVTFRDSNRACAPHLREGMDSKGHDVLTKTFTLESLPKGFEQLAGTVSILPAKPKPGDVIADPMPLRYLTPDGKPLTCDYDLMDVIAATGKRIEGESPRDLEIRAALNAGLPPRGDPPHHVDRIKHGAQAEYPAYLRTVAAHGRPEPVHPELFEPEYPITLFDQEGHVYRLATLEDALNFYRCVGAGTPPEWNLQTRRGQ